MITLSAKLSATAILLSVALSCAAADSRPMVETHYGKVQGVTHQGVNIWTGIPYARPPVNDLRWRAPQPPVKWEGILDAAQPAKICIQPTATGTTGVEDCLNLNIYRPAQSTGSLPVLLYIHGGNNQSGSSADFDPTFIAKKLNAVIVTVNYRLGSLGFNPLKALSTGNALEDSGNYTLLDLKRSLVWVKDNIAQFGGDNHNITVSGFSAGGRDVMAMLISPLFANSFNKAIVFSGGMTTSDKNEAQDIFAQRMADLVVKDGIKKTASEARAWLLSNNKQVKEYLYRLPADRLAAVFGDAGIRMSHFPHLYRDGAVIPREGFATAKYNAVPVIMLTGENEFSFFARGDSHFAPWIKQNTLNNNPVMVNQFNFANGYGSKLYSLFNVELSAEKMYPHYQAPIYGTEIRFGSDRFVTGSKLAPVGSFHGIFLAFWDPKLNSDFIQQAIALPGAQDLTMKFNDYIGSFLHQGQPVSKGGVEWLPWSPENVKKGQSLLMMDANRQRAVLSMSNKDYNEGDVISAMKEDGSVSAVDKKMLIGEVLNGRWFSGKVDETFNQGK